MAEKNKRGPGTEGTCVTNMCDKCVKKAEFADFRFTVVINPCEKRAQVSTLCNVKHPETAVAHPVVCVDGVLAKTMDGTPDLTLLSTGTRAGQRVFSRSSYSHAQ